VICYVRGNLIEADVDALVNTVNEVGVMGKGIALQFKEAFPGNFAVYAEAANHEQIRVGKMFVYRNEQLGGPKWIINFPTKRHWKGSSQIEWIRDGLTDLAKVIRELGIGTIALPPLGCGNGRLEWRSVRREIESALGGLDDVQVVVYVPTTKYYGRKRRDPFRELTPARALIVEVIRRYSVLDTGCTILEVQKLAWFLKRAVDTLHLPDPLELEFKANKYGPYSDRLRHLLDGLDGSYLHCERRLADAGPLDEIAFDASYAPELDLYLKQDEVACYEPALALATAVINGFESPLGMEVLSTIDWLFTQLKIERTPESIRREIGEWPGGRRAAERKRALFDESIVRMAVAQLETELVGAP